MMSLLTRMVAFVAVSLALAAAAPAGAVPAWSRKTGLECSSCHFGGTNRLTKMGRDFLLRGHRMKSDEGISASNYKSLNYLDYASLSNKWRYVASNGNPSTGFDVEAFSLYTGGPLSGKFSYFVEYYFHERGGFSNPGGTSTGTTTNRSKLADAYLQFSSNPQGDNFFWARAGQIYPFIIYTASSGGRLSVNRPISINGNVGLGNLYTPRDRAYGASVGYVNEPGGFRAELGIVNSGGTNARPNLDEKNNFKDGFIALEKDFDEYGSGLGFFAYTGRFLVPKDATFATNWEDRFHRLGFLGHFQRQDYVASVGWFMGENQLPAPANLVTPPAGYTGGSRSPSGYYLEAGVNLSPTLTGYARYDHTYNDLGLLGASRNKAVTVGLSQRMSNVGRIVLEFNGAKSGASAYSRSATVEVNWLF